MPRSRRSRLFTRQIAYHEAGHAVAAYRLGVRVLSVTIKTNAVNRDSIGRTLTLVPPNISIRQLKKDIIISLAGVAAERYVSRIPRKHSRGSSIVDMVRAMGNAETIYICRHHLAEYFAQRSGNSGPLDRHSAAIDAGACRIYHEQEMIARRLMRSSHGRAAVESLAQELLRKKKVTGAQAQRIMRLCLPVVAVGNYAAHRSRL